MMKQFLLTGIAAVCLAGCSSSPKENTVPQLTADQISVFTSSDKQMENAYIWAKKTALSYAHDENDPVGKWYEAALPQREAFCMRDVSHQSVGAHLLGLAGHNKNMFFRFAENISEEKDWCTYWEINRYNKPAPADYASDKEFWYNLNANFDVMQACLKMYEWTGDKDYLTDSCFTNFYNKSVCEYLERWALEPDKIMDRQPYMNTSEDFNPNNNFHTCRGLPSYVENFRGLTVGIDLLCSLYAGFNAYGIMAELDGDSRKAQEAYQKAEAYQRIIEEQWWSAENDYYQTFWTKERKFFRGEGVPFVLWFNATPNISRIQATMKDILSKEWNVENMSAFPALFYRLGYYEDAYRFLTSLPQMDRSEYPEVSYGIVEGIIGGAMGISASAIRNTVTTLSRLPMETQEAEIKNVPVFDGYISVKHQGRQATTIENQTGRELDWVVSFVGEYAQIKAGDKTYEAIQSADAFGNTISECTVSLPAGAILNAEIVTPQHN